jgi:hypothetical protein
MGTLPAALLVVIPGQQSRKDEIWVESTTLAVPQFGKDEM